MDERSDVFGLGALLYEVVSGRRPYGEAKNQEIVLERAKAGAVVPIDQAVLGLGVPARIRAIVDKAVAVNPVERYQTVLELKRDLQAFLRGGLHLPRRNFPSGSVIISEGDSGDAAYLIVSGTCRAYRNVGNQKEVLASMSAGDVFGEMALLLDEPRAASVEAVTPVSVLVLDKHTMIEGLGVNGWTGALVRALAQRFRTLEQAVRKSGMRRGEG
jgi:serine/threonine-protein kinase